VGDAEFLTIGRFARLTGLSIHALRHYDDVSLLIPAHTDPQTGYRRYGRDQIRLAHLIRELRWIDLPIEEIRQVLAEPGQADSVLAGHRKRLLRRRGLLTAQIDNVARLLKKGFTMSAPLSGCRPVQIKIAVDDLATSIAFYQAAFDLRYEVTRRTDDTDQSSFIFGDYGQDGFFLLHLNADPVDTDRPGPTTFGLLVDDLDTRHSRALAAGATEVAAPRELQGMPRSSAVKDLSGNWIWLYQG
jgi:DNA-binding transcriptional MerR regulator